MNISQEKNIPNATFGDRVKSLRESHGLNQAQFAEKIGVKQGFISKVEKNIASFTIDHIILLRNIFGVDLNSLVVGKGKECVAEESPVYGDQRIFSLVENYKALPEEDKQALERLAFSVAQSQKKMKKVS